MRAERDERERKTQKALEVKRSEAAGSMVALLPARCSGFFLFFHTHLIHFLLSLVRGQARLLCSFHEEIDETLLHIIQPTSMRLCSLSSCCCCCLLLLHLNNRIAVTINFRSPRGAIFFLLLPLFLLDFQRLLLYITSTYDWAFSLSSANGCLLYSVHVSTRSQSKQKQRRKHFPNGENSFSCSFCYSFSPPTYYSQTNK